MSTLKFIDFNEIFNSEKVVTNPSPLIKNKFTDDGIFSESIFGKISTDNESNSWSCECGKFIGKFYEGYVCDECKSTVLHKFFNIDNCGWIDLKNFWLIHPVFYNILQKYFGKKVLFNIIKKSNKINQDGQVIEDELTASAEYSGLGLIEFKKKFDDIIEYYKCKKNEKIYNFLIKNRKYIFINKIMIFSILLRPIMMIDKNKVIFDEINNYYNLIISHVNNIFQEEMTGNYLFFSDELYLMQYYLDLIYNTVIEYIKGKHGFIRNNMLGTRFNFSARNVIIPAQSSYKIDEVCMPYVTFNELFKYHIIRLMNKNNNSLKKSLHQWEFLKTRFEEYIYSIMNEILNNTVGGCWILLNRNPTIGYGSILFLKIKEIKRDYKDYTMSVHNCILDLMAADYDGDTLTSIPIFDQELKKTFQVFNPTNMIISNNKFELNSNICIQNDIILGIHNFIS